MIFVLCQRWMPCRGGGGGEEKGGGGVGWRGGGVAKYNGVVKVQLRMCWVLLLLCVLLASWVGELVLKDEKRF